MVSSLLTMFSSRLLDEEHDRVQEQLCHLEQGLRQQAHLVGSSFTSHATVRLTTKLSTNTSLIDATAKEEDQACVSIEDSVQITGN